MGLKAAAETLSESVIQAPVPHTIAIASMGTGALTGSLLVQALAGAASLIVIIHTIFSIRLTMLRIKNEKKDQP